MVGGEVQEHGGTETVLFVTVRFNQLPCLLLSVPLFDISGKIAGSEVFQPLRIGGQLQRTGNQVLAYFRLAVSSSAVVIPVLM